MVDREPIRFDATQTKYSEFGAGDTVGVARGGTGAATPAGALANLGAAAQSDLQPLLDPTPRQALAGTTLSFAGPGIYTTTLTGDTVLTAAASPVQGQRITIEVAPAGFRLDLPTGTRVLEGWFDSDADALNVIELTCVDSTTPQFDAVIRSRRAQKTGIVFRQAAGNYFADYAAAINTPAATPATANLFSDLANLEAYRDRDTGWFDFTYSVTAGGTRTWRFRQPWNPLEQTGAGAGYQLIQTSGGFNDTGFAGLTNHAYIGLVLGAQPTVSPAFAPVNGVFGSIGALNILSGTGQLFGDFGTTTAAVVELFVNQS